MSPLAQIDAVPLFQLERRALLDLLGSLSAEQWARETSCPGWTVKDIAAHIVADDLGRLSGGRDGYSVAWLEADGGDFDGKLLSFINRQNEQWVEAMRRFSPRVIVSLLDLTGDETQEYFESIDPESPSLGVSWAGEAQSAAWFDLARELTERWHHQSQIREAVRAPLLDDPRVFGPVLATFVRALPHTFRDIAAPDGTHVRLRITGPAGGEWSLLRESDAWRLGEARGGQADAAVQLDQDIAWRLFTKGIGPEEAAKRAVLSGDPRLAERVLHTVSIIA